MMRLRAVLMQAGAGTRPRVGFCGWVNIVGAASSCVRLPQFITRGHKATRLKRGGGDDAQTTAMRENIAPQGAPMRALPPQDGQTGGIGHLQQAGLFQHDGAAGLKYQRGGTKTY
jgi:hypothetical protein